MRVHVNELLQSPEYNVAMYLAMTKFKGKTDKGGNRYIDHLMNVKNKVMDIGIDAVVPALLHDILEDTTMTKEELSEQGISNHSIDMIDLLTRKTGEVYSEYISRILDSNSYIALRIKKADIEDNMNLSRIPNFCEEDVKLLEHRYIVNWYKVNDKIKRMERLREELCEMKNM